MLRSIVLTPVWFIQLFGMSKSFKANPIIGSAMLNRLGLHVARVAAAHAVSRLRWWMLSPLASAEHREAFHRDGFVVIRDFLPADQFDALVAEVRSCRGEVRECIQGDTLTHRILLDEDQVASMSACRALLEHPVYERLLMYCAARYKRPLYYIQSIKNGYVNGRDDPQKVLHADTFHPAMKAWLFLEDVTEANGPFTYVPGSHRLTRERLRWEYRKSLTARSLNDGYSEKGSFRVSRDDLRELGLPDPVGLTVPANTLVVADTSGFHCRGQASEKSSRLEIWAYSRSNPFNPFPGVGSRLLSRIECRVAKAYWRYMDRRAARRNTLSSWHPVPIERMHEEA